MKKISFLLICLLCILSVASYSNSINAFSRGKDGNARLRAGLGYSGDLTWSCSAANYFVTSTGIVFDAPGTESKGEGQTEPLKLVTNESTWDITGRWFVTMDLTRPFSSYASDQMNPYKSMGNDGVGHDLSLMFVGSSWVQDDTLKILSFSNSGPKYGAGKFCTFRVRVTDAGGANERYYWVGDTETGLFTYARQWTTDNFVSSPGLGKYGETCDAVWTIAEENIDIYFDVSCIYDQARFEINVINNSSASKYVSVAMYGTPATSNSPAGNWGYKNYWHYTSTYNKDGKCVGNQVTFCENDVESDPCYFYLDGMGAIKKGLILSGNSVPDKLEMYSYRYNNTEVENNVTRRDNPELGDENVDSTYLLPPKSAWLEKTDPENGKTRTVDSNTAFQSVAQATFANNGDATKPDYLIIDMASTMLGTAKEHMYNHYPFGYYTTYAGMSNTSMDQGGFAENTYWPGNEKGVLTPYEDVLPQSHLFSYVDQFTDPMGYMAVWGSKVISPGNRRQIITYYGLGGKSFINGYRKGSVFQRQSHSMFVESPTTLGYRLTKSEFDEDTITPDTFGVKVGVTNQGIEKSYYDFKVKKIKITLDDGLVLASDYDNDGGYLKKSYDSEDEGTNTYYVDKNVNVRMCGVYDSVKIMLQSDNIHSGILSYTVKVIGQDLSGGSDWCQEVTRSILVPTTKTGVIYAGPGNLIACPFKNVKIDGTPGEESFNVSQVFGDDSVGFIWNSETQSYETIDDLSVLRTNPQGFWVLKGLDEDSEKTFPYVYPKFLKANDINYGDVNESKYYMAETYYTINKGWNIISNPYIYPMLMSGVVVKDKVSGDVKSIVDAVNAGWIYQSMFTWEPLKDSTGAYIPEKSKYIARSTSGTELISNRGYWLYSNKSLYMYFNPVFIPNSKIYDDEYFTDPDDCFKMGFTTDENYNNEDF